MVSFEIQIDAKGALTRLLPSLDWALDNELLTEDEAADILADEILATARVVEK